MLPWLQARRIANLLPDRYPEIVQMADVGGGIGLISREIRVILDSEIESTVIDLDEKCREIANQNGRNFVCSTIEKFVSRDEFQLLLLLNVIEHVANPAKVLQRLFDLLQPGGLLVVQTPNFDALDCRLFKNPLGVDYTLRDTG
jgi:2-polyprenyl-3-methyl-5-hydroxy-6-metoxy-1,4-benzoquinol methylase